MYYRPIKTKGVDRMYSRDRNYDLRTQILEGIEEIEKTDSLMRIWRLVRWCLDREYI